MVRRFADACRRNAGETLGGFVPADMVNWLAWLDDAARSIDPLGKGIVGIVRATDRSD
jgi:hypothetical protein